MFNRLPGNPCATILIVAHSLKGRMIAFTGIKADPCDNSRSMCLFILLLLTYGGEQVVIQLIEKSVKG